MAMGPERDPQVAPLSLAAARALFRAPQATDACWADVRLAAGSVRVCGRPEATSLGLCAEHRAELFGLDAERRGASWPESLAAGAGLYPQWAWVRGCTAAPLPTPRPFRQRTVN
jgi:hypothetical protein